MQSASTLHFYCLMSGRCDNASGFGDNCMPWRLGDASPHEREPLCPIISLFKKHQSPRKTVSPYKVKASSREFRLDDQLLPYRVDRELMTDFLPLLLRTTLQSFCSPVKSLLVFYFFFHAQKCEEKKAEWSSQQGSNWFHEVTARLSSSAVVSL